MYITLEDEMKNDSVEEEVEPTGDGARSKGKFPDAMPRPLETQDREVQCADCFAWFSPAANHTCRQQAQRNQRSAKR